MDKDNNNDTSYFNSPDNNNSAGDNHIVYKNMWLSASNWKSVWTDSYLSLVQYLYSSLLAGLITHLILSNTFLMLYHHL